VITGAFNPIFVVFLVGVEGLEPPMETLSTAFTVRANRRYGDTPLFFYKDTINILKNKKKY
jgi:hypothetical protein